MRGQVQSSARRRNTTIGAICSAIAIVCLLVLASGRDSASNKSQRPLRPTPGPAVPLANDAVTHSRANEFPRSDFTAPPQRDDPFDSRNTGLGEDIWLAQQHSSAFDRFEAISALGDSRDATAELTLVSLLHDQDPAIRESAVESLASIGSHGAIQGLGFALTDANPLIRETAAEFLADLGTPDAMDALVITLIDPDVDLRLAAVYELANSESEAGLALLQEFLSDGDPLVREVAAEFLNE